MPPTRNRSTGNVNLSTDPNSRASTAADDNMDAADAIMAGLEEPDQADIVPIYTGRHMWSSTRPSKPGELSPPVVAYEELPFPKGDRAKLPPCTVRWQFTGRFSINREEDIARGSFRVQVRRFLAAQKIAHAECSINFPRGVGRGRFVEITVDPTALAALAQVKLVFNGSALQRLFVGPALPKTAMVIEVLGVPASNAKDETARYIALRLQPFVRVHDVWVAQISYANDPTPPQDTNRMVVLASSAAGKDGGIDPNSVHAIPGYLKIGGAECELSYVGRLPWCTTCRSTASQYHTFDNCPRRRCFNCRASGHSAAQCTAAIGADASAAVQQAQEESRGTNDLNYGSQ